jgi:hypothetical protein
MSNLFLLLVIAAGNDTYSPSASSSSSWISFNSTSKFIQNLCLIAGLYIAAGQESSLHLADTGPESLRKSTICLLPTLLTHKDIVGNRD